MRINIGPYIPYHNPYLLANWLSKLGFNEYKCERVCDYIRNNTPMGKLCYWLNNRKRKVEIEITDDDVRSMDSTLALIITPMLIKLKDSGISLANVDDEDVPENLRRVPKRIIFRNEVNEYDLNYKARWDYILAEMIWAFEQVKPDDNWQEQLTYDAFHVDQLQHQTHSARINNGLRLFGKYYRSLWG